MKITDAKEIVKASIEFNINNEGGSNSSYICPMLWSLPGLGKSTILSDTIAEMGLEEIQLIAAQFDAGELGGYPMVDQENKTYIRARPFFMPTSGKGVIVCDELPQSPTAVQNVIAQLVNERRIGEHFLPEGWTVVCAGNPMSAKAGTNIMPSHLKDRLMHLDIDVDVDAFREYGLSKGFRPEITTYLHERPEWIMKFDPKQNASPSPRSWERVNTILGLPLSTTARNNAIKGYIGEGGLADFTGYLMVWEKMPKFDEVIANPDTHPIPEESMILYALCASIAHRTNKSNVDKVIKYINRFENKEFTAFAFKDLLQRKPELKKEPSVSQWFLTTGKDLLL